MSFSLVTQRTLIFEYAELSICKKQENKSYYPLDEQIIRKIVNINQKHKNYISLTYFLTVS